MRPSQNRWHTNQPARRASRGAKNVVQLVSRLRPSPGHIHVQIHVQRQQVRRRIQPGVQCGPARALPDMQALRRPAPVALIRRRQSGRKSTWASDISDICAAQWATRRLNCGQNRDRIRADARARRALQLGGAGWAWRGRAPGAPPVAGRRPGGVAGAGQRCGAPASALARAGSLSLGGARPSGRALGVGTNPFGRPGARMPELVTYHNKRAASGAAGRQLYPAAARARARRGRARDCGCGARGPQSTGGGAGSPTVAQWRRAPPPAARLNGAGAPRCKKGARAGAGFRQAAVNK